jgi:broad specificity phosphatase PhoE
MHHTQLELWLIRHGETEWSLSGAHTSHTDIPLTTRGREQARAIGECLQFRQFARVMTSPMQRARETCRIAGFGQIAELSEQLREWDYGEFEGRTTSQIREEIPGWSVWNAVPAGGEPLAAVGRRAEAVIESCVTSGGHVALFSHAHFLRILAAVWLGLPPKSGSLFALDTGSISTLGFERESRVIDTWNHCV